jgi:hypothetical protein
MAMSGAAVLVALPDAGDKSFVSKVGGRRGGGLLLPLCFLFRDPNCLTKGRSGMRFRMLGANR